MLYEELRNLGQIDNRGPVFLREGGSETKYSFAQLVAKARQIQGQLQAHGLLKGDRVGLIIPDNEQFIITFLGAVMAGIVPVPIYPPSVVGRFEHYLASTGKILAVSQAKAVIITSLLAPFLELLRTQVTSLESALVFEELEDAPVVCPEHVHLEPDDPCFLQFTSGSTAAPKGVVVTHRNLAANAHAMLKSALALDPNSDLGVSWLPLYHDMGLVGNVLAALLIHVPVVYIPTLAFIKNPQIWMATVSRYRGTVTFGPNFAFSLAAKRATEKYVSKLDLRCLRVVGCGAEPISAEVLRCFQKVFVPAGLNPNAIMPCYGMAEATLAISFDSVSKPPRYERIEREGYEVKRIAKPALGIDCRTSLEVVSCGKTFPEHEVMIISPGGKRLPEGHIGEIVFRGPSVTPGYFGNPQATRETYKDSGLHTGDLGFMQDGEIFVVGRLKDLIIVNGRNYYPQDIEWTVEKVKDVRPGNVVAFGTQEGGTEKIVVVAEAKGSTPLERVQQEIKEATMSALGINLGEVVLIPAGTLPKTTSGKIQRQKTRMAYQQRRLGE